MGPIGGKKKSWYNFNNLKEQKAEIGVGMLSLLQPAVNENPTIVIQLLYSNTKEAEASCRWLFMAIPWNVS